MCLMNHPVVMISSIASPELATRAVMYAAEVGLRQDQVDALRSLALSWRTGYIERVKPVLDLGREIDRHLNDHPVDVAAAEDLATRRRMLVAGIEQEFLQVWKQLVDILDGEQHDRLVEVYRREFAELPHPLLGSDEHEHEGATLPA